MGRELRRVPPNWQHPKNPCNHFCKPNCNGEHYQPMDNETFESAAKNWKEKFLSWEQGKRPDYCDEEHTKLEYWEWVSNPPDRKYYRPYKDEEATWYQVYETVSEGTPVTPPFATQQELVEYLINHGDSWDQELLAKGDSWGRKGWPKEEAEKFVYGDGWAPSMVMENGILKHGTEI
jgi:hypothetical protein